MENHEVFEREFLRPITFWGIVTLLAATIWSFVPPLYMYFAMGIIPSGKAIFTGFALIISFSGFLWVIEPLSYFPILGVPGTYLSFLAGSISNLRVPCSAVAQSATGVEEGSIRGSIISTIAIGTSVLVSVLIITLGVFFGVELLAALPPLAKKALTFILPAVFGGVFGSFAMRNVKLGAISLVISVAILNLPFLPTWSLVPICVFSTLYIGILMKKRAESKEQRAAK